MLPLDQRIEILKVGGTKKKTMGILSIFTKKRRPIEAKRIDVKTLKGFYLYIALTSILMGVVAVTILSNYFNLGANITGTIGVFVTGASYLFISSIYSLDKLNLPINSLISHKDSSRSKLNLIFETLDQSQSQLYAVIESESGIIIDDMNERQLESAIANAKQSIIKFLKTKKVIESEAMYHQLVLTNANLYETLLKYDNSDMDKLASNY